MSGPLARRGFLRGLAALPLVGGAVTLVGQPTAAAVAATPDLRERYIAWLGNEYAAALFERNAGVYRAMPDLNQNWHSTRVRMPFYAFPEAPDIERLTSWSSPSARAAVILSAAGIPLTGDAHG